MGLTKPYQKLGGSSTALTAVQRSSLPITIVSWTSPNVGSGASKNTYHDNIRDTNHTHNSLTRQSVTQGTDLADTIERNYEKINP